jgi:hypothetical protein
VIDFKKFNGIDTKVLIQKRNINEIILEINPKICIPILKECYYVYKIYHYDSFSKVSVTKSESDLFHYRIRVNNISFQFSVAAFDSIMDVLFKQSKLTNSSYEYVIENNNYKYFKRGKRKKVKDDRRVYGKGFIHFPDIYDSKKTLTINLNGDCNNGSVWNDAVSQ